MEIKQLYPDLLDLIENASDLIQAVDPQGRFLYVNRAWREALGYGEGEIPGLTMMDVIHPDARLHCRELFQRVMAGEDVGRVDVAFVRKAGGVIQVEGSVNCRITDGRPVSTRGVFRDITERKELDKLRHEFTSMLVHDLRSPLTSILGYCELMASEEDSFSVAQYRDFAASAAGSGRRMLALINDILDVSKLEAGQVELDATPIAPAALLRDVMTEIRPLAEGKRLRLVSSWTEDLPAIRGESRKLQQVLINLLNNAVKFARGQITLSAMEVDGELEIRIADDGPGIPAAEAGRLFEKWHQTGTGRQSGQGIGLGLAIARLLVEAHGGRIWFEAAPGGGAQFALRLPAASPAVSAPG